MEMLTIIYQRDHNMHWNALVKDNESVKVVGMDSLIAAQEAMYFLISEEFWYRHKSLSSWCIEAEIINYTPGV